MYVLPLLAIQNGESVHVLEAEGQGEARPILDPSEVATRLQGMGAQGLHVVDVNAAQGEARNNDKQLVGILEHTVLPVVAGGGVRSLRRVQELLDTGVQRVLVGTMGVEHPEWLKEAALVFGDRLVACLDVRDHDLLIKGRTETAAARLRAHLDTIDGFGLKTLHLSYVGDNGAGTKLAEGLAARLKTPLTYHGPLGSAEALPRLEAAGVKGVVVGAELYDGRLSLPELAKAYRVR